MKSKSPPAKPGKPATAKTASRPVLGRGLSALLPPSSPTVAAASQAGQSQTLHGAAPLRGLARVSVDDLYPDQAQPRQHFDPRALEELTASVKVHGVLQPLLARKASDGGYRIIAGERRWRAARAAGLTEVPVIVKEIAENDAFEVALIENIQRADLNPVEEAEAYRRLLDEHQLTQEVLSSRVGKERSSISNALRLLKLPEKAKGWLVSGELSPGHAKALLGLEDPEKVEKTAAQVVERGLSVRATEELVTRLKSPVERKPRPELPDDLAKRAADLEQLLGHEVHVRLKADGEGEVVLAFPSQAIGTSLLKRLVNALNKNG